MTFTLTLDPSRTQNRISLASADEVVFSAKLRNNSKFITRIWDPETAEGAMAISALFKTAKGEEIRLPALAPPRSDDHPTAIEIGPGETVLLQGSFRRSIRQTQLSQGAYTVRFVYENQIEKTSPVDDVWTGIVQSQVVNIRVVEK